MPITTDNEKLAAMQFGRWGEAGIPLSPGTLGVDDRQQLIRGYPGITFDGTPDDDTGIPDASHVGPLLGMRFQ